MFTPNERTDAKQVLPPPINGMTSPHFDAKATAEQRQVRSARPLICMCMDRVARIPLRAGAQAVVSVPVMTPRMIVRVIEPRLRIISPRRIIRAITPVRHAMTPSVDMPARPAAPTYLLDESPGVVARCNWHGRRHGRQANDSGDHYKGS